MTSPLHIVIAALGLLWVCPAVAWSGACPPPADGPLKVRGLRLAGDLDAAEADARRMLACPDLPASAAIDLRLELARVLDRRGLHRNTRPVAEAMALVKAAELQIPEGETTARAKVEYALAELHYRAEMGERRFPRALEHVRRAEELCRSLDDLTGLGRAVHLRGLIALQHGQLDSARELFDDSLQLMGDDVTAADDLFLSDYHRHVALVHLRRGDLDASLLHLERSLLHRRAARAPDHTLFAAALLGAVLVDAGRYDEARPHLEAARKLAVELDSPVGELRATFAFAELEERHGGAEAAVAAYRRCLTLAGELRLERTRTLAEEALARLASRSAS